MISLALLAAEGVEGGEHAEPLWELPIPAWSFGAIALVVLLLLLGLVWMFRNMAHTLMYGRDGQPLTSSGAGTRPAPGATGHGMPHGGGH
ncbi:MAG: hypothetical protein IPM90_03780 [Austwickia sp.]|nr:hypothetical protein [Austwickia sp.]